MKIDHEYIKLLEWEKINNSVFESEKDGLIFRLIIFIWNAGISDKIEKEYKIEILDSITNNCLFYNEISEKRFYEYLKKEKRKYEFDLY
jgi:hypothetical protein